MKIISPSHCPSGGRWTLSNLRKGRSLDAGGTLAEAVGDPLPAGPKVEIPSVDWWTTSRCNLACDFCYGPVPGKDPVERRYDILQAIAASSARVVTFCGGEPLLVKKVDEWAASSDLLPSGIIPPTMDYSCGMRAGAPLVCRRRCGAEGRNQRHLQRLGCFTGCRRCRRRGTRSTAGRCREVQLRRPYVQACRSY